MLVVAVFLVLIADERAAKGRSPDVTGYEQAISPTLANSGGSIQNVIASARVRESGSLF